MIFTAGDRDSYFPNVSQTGAALEGLLVLAQSLCESDYGANRPLDYAQHGEVISINSSGFGYLSLLPVYPTPTVIEVRESVDGWGRISGPGWRPLATSEFELDYITGRLDVFVKSSDVKLFYYTGFDFGSGATQEIKNIKAIAGQVVEYFGRYRVGLDSYLNNPAGGAVESYNLVRPDQYLTTLLRPLMKYRPRGSGG